eukprot:364362-Chlamydomonas_euryale.AAC.5
MERRRHFEGKGWVRESPPTSRLGVNEFWLTCTHTADSQHAGRGLADEEGTRITGLGERRRGGRGCIRTVFTVLRSRSAMCVGEAGAAQPTRTSAATSSASRRMVERQDARQGR